MGSAWCAAADQPLIPLLVGHNSAGSQPRPTYRLTTVSMQPWAVSAGLILYAGSPNFWTEPAGICAVFTTSSGQYFSQAWPAPLIPASYHSIVSFYFILGSCFSFQEGWTGTEHFLGEASHFWAGYWLCSQPEFIRSKEMKTSHQVLHCFIVEVDDPT